MLKSKFISKAVSAVASVAMVFTSIPSINVMDKAVAADTMTAFEITKNMKIGWNLGNTLDAKAGDKNGDYATAGLETETSWGCPKANQQLFDALKAKGFNTVRVPTTWFQHLDADNNIDPEWMARVKEVVDYGIKNDMYIILNVHHENWINRADFANAYDEMQPKLMKIWTQIATEFKDYDQHLIFECMNEPRAAGTDHEWWAAEPVPECEVINKLEADFVKLIRGMDGPYAKTRLLMLPGYVASAEQTFLKEIKLPENDKYLAVSIHAYTPYDFTMNTAVKDHSTFTGAYAQNLSDTLQGMRDLFIEKDIPVVIGEMGTSNFGNTQARVDWTTLYFTATKKYGIPCCLWDNNTVENPKDPGECHGYINRTTGEWHEASLPIINKMMEIMNDESIVWGSEGKAPTYTHQDLSAGKVFRDEAIEIDASKSKTYENTTPGQEIAWSELEGKEVAIKYTGTTPVLAFSDKEYGNWTEFKPYTVDEENGIAYYLVSQQLPAAWQDLSTVNHMQARTDKVTTIEKMVILNAPEVQIDVPVDKTKKYKIDFSKKEGEYLALYFEGEANTTTNGAVGFNGDGWQEEKWEGKTDADGKLLVEIPLSKFPADLKSAECQIWYQPELVDMVKYEFYAKNSDTTTTTSETTTTTTETTTTTSETTTATVSETTTTVTESETTTSSESGLSVTVIGDANLDGKCSVADAVAILQNVANKDRFELKPQGKVNGDVDGIAGITANDALVIQKVDAGTLKPEDLPLKAA